MLLRNIFNEIIILCIDNGIIAGDMMVRVTEITVDTARDIITGVDCCPAIAGNIEEQREFLIAQYGF